MIEFRDACVVYQGEGSLGPVEALRDGSLGVGESLTLDAWGAITSTPGIDSGDYAFSAGGDYRDRDWEFALGFHQVGDGFNPEVGFLSRDDYRSVNARVLRHIRFPNVPWFREIRPHASWSEFWDMEGFSETRFIHIDNHFEFANGAFFQLPGLNITGVCLPCRTVGGDWFDYVPLGDGHTAVVLGDVAGKGSAAALLMSSTRSLLRLVARDVRTHDHLGDADIARPVERGIHQLLADAATPNRIVDDEADDLDAITRFQHQPVFDREVAHLQTLIGGTVEVERVAIAHQVYAAYRRADLDDMLIVLERARVYEPTVLEAAATFKVDPEVLIGVGAAESSYHPRRSVDGGEGLFQITKAPATALRDVDSCDCRTAWMFSRKHSSVGPASKMST